VPPCGLPVPHRGLIVPRCDQPDHISADMFPVADDMFRVAVGSRQVADDSHQVVVLALHVVARTVSPTRVRLLSAFCLSAVRFAAPLRSRSDDMTTNAKKTVTTRNPAQEMTAMKKIAKQHATTTNTANQEVTTMKKIAKKSATKTSNPNAEATSSLLVTHSSAPEVAAASPSTAASATTSSSNVAMQLQALEQTCGYGDPLPDDTRKASEKLVRRVPLAIVDRVIALAVRGGGTVAGIKLDPTATKAALAAADDADAVATAGLMLVRRAQDQAVRLRTGVASDVSGIKTALRGYVKTAQGAALAQEADELRTLAKAHAAVAKARKTRTENALTAAAEPETPTPTVPPAATPTPTPPTAPKAS
jgi:hypothetical protein